MSLCLLGSSLRAQGTHLIRSYPVCHYRFIPAGAGNTYPEWRWRSCPAVHPCGRREHIVRPYLLFYFSGSSLRAQGTQPIHQQCGRLVRFIPAGAGNTFRMPDCSGVTTVHPCGRREHLVIFVPAGCTTGSSLRAQGTQEMFVLFVDHCRFIPAGARNTLKKYTDISTHYKGIKFHQKILRFCQ